MPKGLVTTITAAAAAMLLTVTAADAATYAFNFQSNNSQITASGRFTLDASNEVTGVAGAVSGLTNQAITGVTDNPNFQGFVLQFGRLLHLSPPRVIPAASSVFRFGAIPLRTVR